MRTATGIPSLDRTLMYGSGSCRLRVFEDDHIAVLTQTPTSIPSVTNAIEEAAQVVEDLLGVRFAEHPTLMVPVSWSLIEHYAASDARLSLVSFAGRDAEARLEGPSWRYIQPGELPWLDEALSE